MAERGIPGAENFKAEKLVEVKNNEFKINPNAPSSVKIPEKDGNYVDYSKVNEKLEQKEEQKEKQREIAESYLADKQRGNESGIDYSQTPQAKKAENEDLVDSYKKQFEGRVEIEAETHKFTKEEKDKQLRQELIDNIRGGRKTVEPTQAAMSAQTGIKSGENVDIATQNLADVPNAEAVMDKFKKEQAGGVLESYLADVPNAEAMMDTMKRGRGMEVAIENTATPGSTETKTDANKAENKAKNEGVMKKIKEKMKDFLNNFDPRDKNAEWLVSAFCGGAVGGALTYTGSAGIFGRVMMTSAVAAGLSVVDKGIFSLKHRKLVKENSGEGNKAKLEEKIKELNEKRAKGQDRISNIMKGFTAGFTIGGFGGIGVDIAREKFGSFIANNSVSEAFNQGALAFGKIPEKVVDMLTPTANAGIDIPTVNTGILDKKVGDLNIVDVVGIAAVYKVGKETFRYVADKVRGRIKGGSSAKGGGEGKT